MADEVKRIDDVNRRQFFTRLGLGSLSIAAAGTAAFSYQFLEPNVLYEPSPVVNAGKPDRYPLDSVTLDVNSGIYIIHSQEGYFSLSAVCTHLARELARDGEGAKRLIEVEVAGATSLEDARRVSRTIASSPLVKTAVTGCDPNWGRILVAAGRAGAKVDTGLASLALQGRLLFERGRVLPFEEAAMRSLLDAPEVSIRLDLGLGDASATAWGCDLTTEYVSINADYTT